MYLVTFGGYTTLCVCIWYPYSLAHALSGAIKVDTLWLGPLDPGWEDGASKTSCYTAAVIHFVYMHVYRNRDNQQILVSAAVLRY